MKKLILVLLILASSVLSAETAYVMSQEDYYELCFDIATTKSDPQLNTILENIRGKLKSETREVIKTFHKKAETCFSNDTKEYDTITRVINVLDYYVKRGSETITLDTWKLEWCKNMLKMYMREDFESRKLFFDRNFEIINWSPEAIKIMEAKKNDINEKLSILGGKISLLEMELINHEIIMRSHGWKTE